MSDTGYGTSYRGDLSGEINQYYYQYPSDRHGTKIKIDTDALHKVVHVQEGVTKNTPIISYPDGMRVGCTFITNEALGKLWDFHQEYRNRNEYLEHQSGS